MSHVVFVYRKRATNKLKNRRHHSCVNPGFTQSIIYISLNVNLNIHLAALFYPTRCLLLICFFLYLPP